LGVAILAALAAMTVGASGAQAANFTAASYPAFISAEPSSAGTPTLAFEAGSKAACESFGFGGGISAATSSLSLGPGINGCTNFGAAGAVETNGCEFVFHPGTGSADNFTGTFDITCPAGKKIVVTGNGTGASCLQTGDNRSESRRSHLPAEKHGWVRLHQGG
jgi:hypothetical protein